MRRGCCVLILLFASVPFSIASAGEGLTSFSVDPAANVQSQSSASAAKTPLGVSCERGIVEVRAVSNELFEWNDQSYSMRDLVKALRGASKKSRFNCVVVNGGEPTTAQVMRLVKDLSSRNIKHVEWAGTRPAKSTGEK